MSRDDEPRCPMCGHRMRLLKSKTTLAGLKGFVRTSSYECLICGRHSFVKSLPSWKP